MIMFKLLARLLKKKPRSFPKYQLEDLVYQGDETSELNKIVVEFKSYISQEMIMFHQLQYQKPIDTLMYQLFIRDYKHIARPIQLEAFNRILVDDSISMSYGRFLDTIQIIYMTTDVRYLNILKNKYLMTVTRFLSGNREAAPTEEDWLFALDMFPWLFLMPIYVVTMQNHDEMSKLPKDNTPNVEPPTKLMV